MKWYFMPPEIFIINVMNVCLATEIISLKIFYLFAYLLFFWLSNEETKMNNYYSVYRLF